MINYRVQHLDDSRNFALAHAWEHGKAEDPGARVFRAAEWTRLLEPPGRARLQVDGCRVMDTRPDPVGSEDVSHLVTPRDLDHELVVHVETVVHISRADANRVSQAGAVSLGDLASLLDLGVQSFQFLCENESLEVVETLAAAYIGMHVGRRGDLRLEDPYRSGDFIESGVLNCDRCGIDYPVIAGIPRFEGDRSNSPESTAGHFEREFTALSEADRDIEAPEMAEYYFFTRSAIDPRVFEAFSDDYFRTDLEDAGSYEPDYSSITGKMVLDAGCGAGRFTRVVGQKAGLAVGLELGGHIDRAARLCDGLENVQFVQGSVLHPPFKKGVFDLVFSLGVLHHTPDPRGGCLRLADLVSNGGFLSVWVYPPEYWNGPVRGPVARLMNRFVSRLPGSAAHWFCARMLYPLGRLQGFLARRRWSKLLLAPFFLLSVPRHPQREIMINTIYDYYGPRLISTHTYEEVEGWFRQAGLASLRRGGLPTSWVGAREEGAPSPAMSE